MFRGYYWRRLEQLTRSPFAAFLLGANLFAAVHNYSLHGRFWVLLFGLIAGAFFLWRRTLWPLIVGHWLWNCWGTLVR